MRLFWKLFVYSYKKSSHRKSKFSPFPNLFPSYKLQIHPVNPTNPDILKFITKFL